MSNAQEVIRGETVGRFMRRFARTEAGKVELPPLFIPPRPAPRNVHREAVEEAKRLGFAAFVFGPFTVSVE